MNRQLARSLYATSALVGASGLALGWCVYFALPTDPDTLVHPWQPALQHAHVLAAPASTLALGAAWIAHAWPKWRAGEPPGRRSGAALVALGVAMIASGYLLQIAESLEARRAWSFAHSACSIAWLAALALHALRMRAAQAPS
ncbi:MAG: hypothetical protein EPO68_14415 [Planctomycetota bacterium]|nr:MAG: hypothetical protein EPO68_14415 [Planctomycetota bacterium]